MKMSPYRRGSKGTEEIPPKKKGSIKVVPAWLRKRNKKDHPHITRLLSFVGDLFCQTTLNSLLHVDRQCFKRPPEIKLTHW